MSQGVEIFFNNIPFRLLSMREGGGMESIIARVTAKDRYVFGPIYLPKIAIDAKILLRRMPMVIGTDFPIKDYFVLTVMTNDHDQVTRARRNLLAQLGEL